MKNAAVIGAGTIGLSWTALFAHHGLDQLEVETIRKRSSKRELFEFVVSARI